MARTIALLLALAAFAALLVWMMLRGDGGGEAVAPVPPTLPETETPADLVPAETPDDSAPDAAIPTRATLPVEDGEPEPIGRGLRVRVLDPEGKPRGGVMVTLFGIAPGGQEMPLGDERCLTGFAANTDPETTREERRRFRVGSEFGLAEWTGEKGMLAQMWKAIDDGKVDRGLPGLAVGLVHPESDQQRVTLDLAAWPDEEIVFTLTEAQDAMLDPLRVQVVFADGTPAPGVPVGLYMIPRDNHLGDLSDLDHATTAGPDGIAEFRRERQLELLAQMRMMGAEADLFVMVEIPLRVPPREAVAFLPERDEFRRLVLPPVTRVAVEITRADGRPFPFAETPAEMRINWTLSGEGNPHPQKRDDRKMERYVVDSFPFDLGWIGAGMEIDARAWPRDSSAPGGAVTTRIAPDAEGKQTLPIAFEEPYPRLRLTLVDGAGSPFVERTVRTCRRELDAADGASKRFWRTATSDDEGRIVVRMNNLRAEVAELLEIAIESEEEGPWGAHPLPESLPPSPPRISEEDWLPPPIDGGSVTMRDDPPSAPERPAELLLASGLVTDESGAPLYGAWVFAAALEGRSSARMRSSSDGSFELKSDELFPFSLEIQRPGYLSIIDSPLEAGSTGLRYTLVEGGRIEGTITSGFERGFSLMHITPRAKIGDSERRGVISFPDQLRFSGLPAGQATITLRTESPTFELLRVEGIEVRLGETTTDPRLEGIDLAALARSFELEITGPDGAPLQNERVRIAIPGYGESSFQMKGRAKRKITLPREAARITLGGRGLRPVELDTAGSGAEVRFVRE